MQKSSIYLASAAFTTLSIAPSAMAAKDAERNAIGPSNVQMSTHRQNAGGYRPDQSTRPAFASLDLGPCGNIKNCCT